MTIKLKVRKLVYDAQGWKAYASYIGDSVKTVELLKRETTYYLETIEDLDGVMDAVPDDLRAEVRTLFR